MKHIRYNETKKLYQIRKTINNKNEFFGSYKNLEEAKLAVELLEKTGWHKEDDWAIRAEVKEQMEAKQNAS